MQANVETANTSPHGGVVAEQRPSVNGSSREIKKADAKVTSDRKLEAKHYDVEAGNDDVIVVQFPSARSLVRFGQKDSEAELRNQRHQSITEAVEAANDDHKVPLSELASRVDTHIDFARPSKSRGLTPEEAANRLAENGPNCLTPPPPVPLWRMFFKQLTSPLNLLLLIAGVLCFVIAAVSQANVSEPVTLGAVLFFVAFGNASIDFYQTVKAEKVLKSFGSLLPGVQVVVRNGEKVEIDPLELVVGDLVILKSGNRVPADVRFIKVSEVKVDNSSLTGESIGQVRKTETTQDNVLEAENMGFFGTVLIGGVGTAVVLKTGDATVMGQIASAVSNSGPKKVSPLTTEMHQLVKFTAIMATITGSVLFIIGMIINPVFVNNFIFFIGIFVAFVPQGVPATVTMLLTLAAETLRDINVLVKDLHAVDTLGTITLLASDKTGTLTQNRMTVVELWLNQIHYSTEELKSAAVREVSTYASSVPNANLMENAFVLCSAAYYRNPKHAADAAATPGGGGGEDAARAVMPPPPPGPEGEGDIAGDATETGLLRFAVDMLAKPTGQEPPDYVQMSRDKHRNVLNLPFDSTKKWSMAIVQLEHADGIYTLIIKGAPERVLAMCTTSLCGKDGATVPIDETFNATFNQAYEAMAGGGQRVLGVACLRLPLAEFPANFEFIAGEAANFPQAGYSFVGLVGLRDPPKLGVAEAVDKCRGAGIKVVMVTGDHPLTAAAIARQVNIIRTDDGSAAVVAGSELDSLSNRQWNDILTKKEIVFARTSPQHKLEIVVRMQALGHTVGVTGDGVNDSPALKRADMGISMAISGSDVSKEAASIILMDDNFASVVEGIRCGRLVFANLKKSIMYTLTHITPEVMPFLLYIIIGIPVPLNSFLILTIDLLTEIGPALSYSHEVAEDNIMTVRPRKSVKPNPGAMVVDRNETASLANMRGVQLQEVDIDTDEHQAAAHRLGYYWFKMFQWRVKDTEDVDETLVDRKLLRWSYIEGGLILSGGCLGAYFWEMALNDLSASELMGAGRNYFSTGADDYTADNGMVYTEGEQMKLLHKAQSAYYLSLVIMQGFTCYLAKSSDISTVGKRYLKNPYTYMASSFSIALAFFMVYCPGVQWVVQARPIHLRVLISPVVGGLIFFLYETVKRRIFPDVKASGEASMK